MSAKKHHLFKGILLSFIALLISTNLCFAQSKSEKVDEMLTLYNDYAKFNGSVLVADEGNVIYKNGFGMANMEWDIPNTASTKHRLGSITKQFTAMLALQLISEGKLELHEPISKYLSEYPKPSSEKITIHHLLTHTSGLPNYTDFDDFMKDNSRDPYSPMDFLEEFAYKDLEFVPGSRFKYSNSGYFLLGVLIEVVSTSTYEELLHEKIFEPLGMNNSGFDHHRDILKNRATGYEKNGTTYVNSRYLDMSIPYAAGSMYSTVEDLYIWDQALYTNKLLTQKYMDLYFQAHIQAFGDLYYAYGWAVGKSNVGNGNDSIYVNSHGGGINGFNTIITRLPETKSLVVLLNNTGGAPLNEIAQKISAILLEKAYDLPKQSLANHIHDLIGRKGIENARTQYKLLKSDTQFELNENEMNQIGYQLMNEDKLKEALQVFKWNLDAFPTSFNVYDSYGEALMNLGRNELAIENYRKSVDINPGNQNGLDMLQKLGVDTESLVEEIVVPLEILETYVGDYELQPGFILTIFLDGVQLKAQATGQQAIDLYPKSNKVFYVKVIDAQVTFNLIDSGQIESLTLLQNGAEIIGNKIDE